MKGEIQLPKRTAEQVDSARINMQGEKWADVEGYEGIYEVCIANISPKERRMRLRFGIVQFAISLVILGALLFFGVDKVWRLPLFFMFAAAAAGYFQWRDKT